jgi:hypothetical protein
MRSYKNGDEMREALGKYLKPGDAVLYHGVVHTVVDAGPVQGMRIAAICNLEPLLETLDEMKGVGV